MLRDNGRRRAAERGKPSELARIAPLMGIPALLRELGCEPEAILEGVGLKPEQFADPDTKIPFVAGGRLLARCVRATGCGHFGLRLAERVGPSVLGVTGFLLRSAPDVGTALRELVRYLDLHDRGGVATLNTSGRMSVLAYLIHQDGVEAADQIYDLSIGAGCNIIRSLCGADWNPSEVLLSRRPPRDRTPYARFFRAPVHFDADQSAIVFPTRWLDCALSSADPLLHRHLEKEAATLKARQREDFVGNLRPVLRELLTSQHCSAAEAARQLGMHERTLDRRLQAEGTSFRTELDAIRSDVAKQYLAETAMTLAEIASALDYADASAFSRAFKRWSGITPARWRARNTRR